MTTDALVQVKYTRTDTLKIRVKEGREEACGSWTWTCVDVFLAERMSVEGERRRKRGNIIVKGTERMIAL